MFLGAGLTQLYKPPAVAWAQHRNPTVPAGNVCRIKAGAAEGPVQGCGRWVTGAGVW